MLVVDRREGEGTYDPGVNRAAVQAELSKHAFHSSSVLKSNVIPAQVEVESPPTTMGLKSQTSPQKGGAAMLPGIPVVVKTPGPAALLKLLTERVWGIDMP
jgi:hypothetical protein